MTLAETIAALTPVMEWIKGIIVILAPVAAAYFIWRQREADVQLLAVSKDVNTVKKDVEVVKAVGNSTLREAMAATVVATEGKAAITNNREDLIAAEVAKQRLAEHDIAQLRAKEERTAQDAPPGAVVVTTEVKKVASQVKEQVKEAVSTVVDEVKKASAEVVDEVKKHVDDIAAAKLKEKAEHEKKQIIVDK